LAFALRDCSETDFEQPTIFKLGSVDFLTGVYCLGFLDVVMGFLPSWHAKEFNQIVVSHSESLIYKTSLCIRNKISLYHKQQVLIAFEDQPSYLYAPSQTGRTLEAKAAVTHWVYLFTGRKYFEETPTPP
jgi:hypothetical protein